MKRTIAIYGIPDPVGSECLFYTHDHSLCIMEEGHITEYLQLERLTGKKYDNTLPAYIERLLDDGLIPNPKNAEWIFVNSFAGNDFRSVSGKVGFETSVRQCLSASLVKGKGWLNPISGLEGEISAWSIDHELAHICSNIPFHGEFRDNSLLIHFDGGASLGNFSAFHFLNGKINVLEFHWNLSRLSKFFNDNALTFALLNHQPGEHCAVPGKLMGFATMGQYRSDLESWLRDNEWFKEAWSDKSNFYQQAGNLFGWHGRLGDTTDPFLQDIAATFQKIFQNEWLGYLSQLQEKVKADFLYLSGGCALNIVANTQIINSGLFRDVFIPPCPGDSGLSIGAAAFAQWQKGFRVALHSPYLNNIGMSSGNMEVDPDCIREVAALLSAGAVIGLCNGYGEAGPRALGNRSIIARPDSKTLSARVSVTCKGREWYRPVAPVMLEKNAKKLTDQPAIHHLSRFMLLDFPVPERFRKGIEGVVHANGTSRMQTLFSRNENPFLWDLLNYLDENYDIPALINTSFNAQGKPIVHSPEDALESAESMGLDAVVVNGRLKLIKNISYELEKDNNF